MKQYSSKEHENAVSRIIRGETLSDKAYDEMKKMILQMEPGENKLPPEEDLAEMMGVSRATVREALKRLQRERVITTIHGKGTFAHPSFYSMENRMDLDSDFLVLLEKNHGDVTLDMEIYGVKEPTELYREAFPERPDPLSTGWTYCADGRPVIYGYFEICPDRIANWNFDLKGVYNWPLFSSRYMTDPIDSCTMKLEPAISLQAEERLYLPEGSPVIMAKELLYDMGDRVCAVGHVYIHPEELPLSFVTYL